MESTIEQSNPTCDGGENTLDANMQTYSDVFASTGRKQSTIGTGQRYIRNMAKAVGGKDPATWTEDDIQTFILSDAYTNWAPATQRTAKAILKSYLGVLGCHDLLPPNLFHFWKDRTSYSGGSNTYDKLKAGTPTASEVDTVLEVCRDVILSSSSDLEVYRHMALYFNAAYGLRRMEVAGLRACDINLKDKTLHVELSKGDKSRDVFMDIPITDDVWSCFMVARSSIIARLRAKVSDVHTIAKLDSLSDRAATLFFTRANGETGGPASPDSVGAMIARIASHILGRQVNSHSFRHAKAFYLLEVRRIEPHQAKEYLGHSNIQQTLDYSYTGVEEQKAAFENGGGEPAPAPAAAPAPSQAGKLDAAVGALTAAYTRGDLSAEAFAAAVAALSSGSS